MKGSIPAPPRPLNLKEYIDKCVVETDTRSTTLLKLYESDKLSQLDYLLEIGKVLAEFYKNVATFKENKL